MRKRILYGLLALGLAAPCSAANVCAWMKESVAEDDLHKVQIWIQADADLQFLYKVDGPGLVDDSGHANSPTTATYSLDAGQAKTMWDFGATMVPPGKIDIRLELHEWPKDIFSKEATPLLAAFSFQRSVPAGEKTPPATLAKKQCAAVKDAVP